MMKFWPGFALLIVLGWSSQAMAAIRPSFSLEDSTWNATDIVVATEGDAIDGKLQVLKVWKGNLRVDSIIFVPELSAFAPVARRTVSTGFREKNEQPPLHVTGSKLVLFLKKPTDASGKWQPANRYKDMNVSVVWLEQGKAYAFVQVMNPGPSVLTSLRLPEAEISAQVNEILQAQTALVKASALKNLAQRAQALRPFVSSKHYFARQLAFEELSKCGDAALPVLRAMLNDKTLLSQHGAVIKTLGKAGGKTVGPELTRLVEAETKFWKQTAPRLKSGWWNGTGLQWSEVETLRDRYTKVLSALYALKQIKYSGSKSAVTELRNFWRSLPQLDDKSGINQMSEECDNVLKALSAT